VRVAAGVACQDEAGRLWMLRWAIRRQNGGRVVPFAVHEDKGYLKPKGTTSRTSKMIKMISKSPTRPPAW
jgi:hypothetical protein